MTACNYFVGKGLTNFQAAGIVGNLDQESGVNPGAVQSGGPGRGIAQWSVGGRWDTDSNDNAVAYASKEGQSVLSLQLQLDFIWYELTTFSGYGLASLKGTTNVTDATVVFETDFEGCGQCDQSTRISYAEGVLPSCEASAAVPYAAQFVSQSFPLASTTLTMTEGQVIPSYIELKNTGTKAWDSNTHLGTTQPRDRKSVFADGTWLAANRPAGVKGTVAPGGTYKFTFDLAAPSTPGTYDEFFGVVQEGVAWFSDPGQGGPPDNDLEVKITVVAPKDPPADAGEAEDGAVDAGHEGDAGEPADDAGETKGDAGGLGSPTGHDAGGQRPRRWEPAPAMPVRTAMAPPAVAPAAAASVSVVARRRRAPPRWGSSSCSAPSPAGAAPAGSPEILGSPPVPGGGLVEAARDAGVLRVRHVQPVVVLARGRRTFGPHLGETAGVDRARRPGPARALVLRGLGALGERRVGLVRRVVGLRLPIDARFVGGAALGERGHVQRGAILIDDLEALRARRRERIAGAAGTGASGAATRAADGQHGGEPAPRPSRTP